MYLSRLHARASSASICVRGHGFSAALTDEWALNVTYKYACGETRTSLKKANELRALGEAVSAIASTVTNASRSARPASISATALSSTVSSAGCAHRRLRYGDEEDRQGKPGAVIGYDNDINIQRRQAGKAPRSPHRPAAHARSSTARDDRGRRCPLCCMHCCDAIAARRQCSMLHDLQSDVAGPSN